MANYIWCKPTFIHLLYTLVEVSVLSHLSMLYVDIFLPLFISFKYILVSIFALWATLFILQRRLMWLLLSLFCFFLHHFPFDFHTVFFNVSRNVIRDWRRIWVDAYSLFFSWWCLYIYLIGFSYWVLLVTRPFLCDQGCLVIGAL